ncbi:MAG: hypothetical protein AAB074_07085 [Planctomycetota bacterium]
MKWALPLVIVAAVLSAVAAEPLPRRDEGDEKEKYDGPLVGDKAPAFTLKLLGSEETLRLRDLRGKPTVLIFGSYT